MGFMEELEARQPKKSVGGIGGANAAAAAAMAAIQPKAVSAEDQQQADNQKQQLALANRNRALMPERSDQEYGQYSTGARRQLADNIQSVRAGYNHRGLLHSGARQGAEFNQQANGTGSRNDLNAARFKINQNLRAGVNQMDGHAFDAGAGIAGLGSGLGSSALGGAQDQMGYDTANMNAQSQLYGGIGSGLGTLAGYMYGNR